MCGERGNELFPNAHHLIASDKVKDEEKLFFHAWKFLIAFHVSRQFSSSELLIDDELKFKAFLGISTSHISHNFHILVRRKKFSWLFSFFLGRKLKRWKLIDVAKLFVAGTGPNFGPKMNLKTEIERNENSIELLTLIFFFSSLLSLNRVC